ncbi:MAG: arginine deiminase-related protein [Chitinophagales bacterium]|nr:arginine deiminase-related protein [Chitinophagales bacterium]MDW8418495.1 arginine deiminase-related protein [Chitinophagales bacterium]
MVRPAAFGYNEQTEFSNAFQQKASTSKKDIQQTAIREFDNLVNILVANGVGVVVYQDTVPPERPDAVFPNNWFSTHPDGTFVLYPMFAPNRRAERTPEAIKKILQVYEARNTIDLTCYEVEGRYLEGTGSMVFDHSNHVAYVSRSVRTDASLARELCARLGYECVLFSATDEDGKPVYHTNVVLSIDEHLAIVCLDAITENREEVLKRLRDGRKHIVYITLDQMRKFAANALMLKNRYNEKLLVMSDAAFHSFTKEQKKIIMQTCKILHAPISTIEQTGGGSVRCMMAELFI